MTECNIIKSVNPLYLRIIDIKGQFEKGKDDAWYLVISDKDDVYKKLVDIFESIKNEIIEKTWERILMDFLSRRFGKKNKDIN